MRTCDTVSLSSSYKVHLYSCKTYTPFYIHIYILCTCQTKAVLSHAPDILRQSTFNAVTPILTYSLAPCTSADICFFNSPQHPGLSETPWSLHQSALQVFLTIIFNCTTNLFISVSMIYLLSVIKKMKNYNGSYFQMSS